MPLAGRLRQMPMQVRYVTLLCDLWHVLATKSFKNPAAMPRFAVAVRLLLRASPALPTSQRILEALHRFFVSLVRDYLVPVHRKQ